MIPTVEQVQTRLKQILLDALTEPPAADDIAADVPLVKEGLSLDSVALLEFVIGIENEFDVLLDDESLTVEHFESLAALAAFVQGKLHEQSPRRLAA